MTIDDRTLSETGLTQDIGGRHLLIACGALAHELLAIIRANRWTHFDLQCLPAKLHNSPDKIPDAVTAAVQEHEAQYDTISIVYADCGTGGLLEARCKELGVAMIPGPHCYSFFDGNEVFSARDETTAFYLTDFLTRQFDAFVWKPLGLDRHPDLRDMYFGNYTHVIYLAQTENPELTRQAENCAQRLGLKFKRRFTGYGDLERFLNEQSLSI